MSKAPRQDRAERPAERLAEIIEAVDADHRIHRDRPVVALPNDLLLDKELDVALGGAMNDELGAGSHPEPQLEAKRVPMNRTRKNSRRTCRPSFANRAREAMR